MPTRENFPLDQRRRLRARLLRWFGSNRRVLPWRLTRDPYRIWVSEVMLQQTRVGAVVEHYQKFLRRFPTVAALAAAPPDDVLAAWSGLGYYRRARALHAAARTIVQQHAGRLPRTSAELQTLPGIGRYTAAAVASIAFGQPCAVVDGNVARVLRRVLGKPEALLGEVWEAAEELLSRRNPGDFNQALMELGATVCLPREPRCPQCPVRVLCAAQGKGIPVRTGSRRCTVEAAYLLARRDGCVYLVRRSQKQSLMPGMWELPTCEMGPRPAFVLRHAITNTDYRVSVIVDSDGAGLHGGRWVRAGATAELPLTGLTRKILRRAGVI